MSGESFESLCIQAAGSGEAECFNGLLFGWHVPEVMVDACAVVVIWLRGEGI